MKLTEALLGAIRACLFLVPALPLLCGNDPPGAAVSTPALFFPDSTAKGFAFRILVELAFGAWLLLAFWEPRYRPRRSPVLLALIASTAIFGIADLCGIDPGRSVWGNLERLGGLAGELHLLALFVVLGSVMETRRLWWRYFTWSLAVSVVVAIFALAQSARFHWGIEWLPDWLSRAHVYDRHADLRFRADARLGNPVWLGVYLALHVLIAAHWALRPGAHRWRYIAVGTLLLIALLPTGTRSAIFGLALGALVATASGWRRLSRRHRGRLIAIAALLGVGLVTLPWWLPGWGWDSDALARWGRISFHIERRLNVWDVGLRGVAEHPWLGWGQECFRYAYERHFIPPLTSLRSHWDRAHNGLVEALVSAGIPGLLAWLAVPAAALAMIWRPARPAAAFEKAALTAIVVTHFFFNQFEFDVVASSSIWLAVLAYLHTQHAPARTTPRRRPHPALALLVTVAAVGATATALRAFVLVDLRVCHWIGLALTERRLDQRLQHFERAVEVDSIGREEARMQLAATALAIAADERVPRAMVTRFNTRGIEELEQAAAKSPVSVILLLQLSLLYSEAARHTDAAAVLERAVELSPGNVMLRCELGLQYHLLGRLDDAERVLRSAQALSRSKEPLVRMVLMALENGRSQLEQEALAKLHPPARRPRQPDPRILEGLVRHGRGETALSLQEDWVARLEARHPRGVFIAEQLRQSYTSLANLYATLQMWDRAEQTLERAVGNLPEFADEAARMQRNLSALRGR